MSDILLRRAEPDGRRHLGSDLAMLGKWVEAATFAAPSHQIAQITLSELSRRDQEKLFAGSRQDYAFARRQDGSPKLQEVKVRGERELDPEARAFKAEYNKQMTNQDAGELRAWQDKVNSALRNDGNMPWGCQRGIRLHQHDPPAHVRFPAPQHNTPTESYTHEHFALQNINQYNETRSLDSVHDSDDTLTVRPSPGEPSKRPMGHKAEPSNGAKIYPNFYPPSMVARLAAGKNNLSSSLDATPSYNTFRPAQANFPSDHSNNTFPFPLYSASPDHGSDTTTFDSSPAYFSDATLPSRRLSQNSDSSMDSVFDSFGGVGLHATAPTVDPPNSNPRVPPRGGLGAGLSKACRNGDFSNNTQAVPAVPRYNFMPPGYKSSLHLPVQQQVSSPGLVDRFDISSAAASAFPASCGTTGVSRPAFVHGETSPRTPQLKSPEFPFAKAQPYPGITFYDVPPGRRSDDSLVPAYWTTKEDKARLLALKLQNLKRVDADMLENPDTKVPASNIHIFVDLSNIVIGFYDALKRNRNLPAEKRIKAPGFSFENFHTVLSRGRRVEKSVVAGSRTSGTQKTPEYMRQAESLGYEMNIMRRLTKEKNSKSEQGVDELLHLKILQCPYDHDVGTIVLATGDAAEAEFSDGFKKNVERVLKCGWNLELYGWSHTMSSAWRDTGFLASYGNQIRIIKLDPFIEELYEMSIDML